MFRSVIVALAAMFVMGCSGETEQPLVAAGDGANVDNHVTPISDAGDSPQSATAETAVSGEAADASASNGASDNSQSADGEKSNLREEHEDEITTRIGRAILDVLDERDGGTDDERDAVIATLKLHDQMLHRASGRRAKQLILQNNNRPRRSLYIRPPAD